MVWQERKGMSVSPHFHVVECCLQLTVRYMSAENLWGESGRDHKGIDPIMIPA